MCEALEARVAAVLEGLGVPFEVLDCDPEFADTAAFCERYGVAPEDSANTIIVATKREPKSYCACVLLATSRLDVNKAVKRLLGSRCSFASAEETRALTGMMIGGVTPPGLPEGLPLYVDRAVMEREAVILGGGSRSKKVRVSPRIFELWDRAELVDGLAK